MGDTARTRSRANASAGWAAAVVVVLSFSPTTAQAYRTLADLPSVDQRARWTSTALDWDLDVAELGADEVRRSELESAVNAALRVLEGAECGGFAFHAMGTSTRAAAAGDGRNTLCVVGRDWEARGFPADQGAFTDVQIEVDAEGRARIVEADIYLNFDLYEFAPLPDTGGMSGVLDLETVVLHEALHAFGGLLHPCEIDGAGGAPDCAAVTDAMASAIYPLYQDTPPGLSADDQAGLCSVYGDCSPTCPVGSSCLRGLCEPDACVEPECGVCSEDCGAPRCSADTECTEGTCGVVGAVTGFCVPQGSPGAGCGAATDCASGLCLTSARAGRYCTFTCDDDAPCGADQYCASVDGRSVCAPRPPTGGCSATHPARRGSMCVWGFICCCALLTGVRRRHSCVAR